MSRKRKRVAKERRKRVMKYYRKREVTVAWEQQ